MEFAGMNLRAVLVAAIASFLFGGVWYSLFSRQWRAAADIEETHSSRSEWHVNAMPFIVAFIGLLVMAYVLAGVIGHLGPGQVTVRNGVISGAFIWVGFVMTTLVTNNVFRRANRTMTLIDGGHWLGVLVLQGAVIGWFGT